MEKRHDWFYCLVITVMLLSWQLIDQTNKARDCQDRLSISQQRLEATKDTINLLRGFK